MIYLSAVERTVISIATIIILLILGYVLLKWMKHQRKKITKTKMMTLNDVIKYPKFRAFVEYEIKRDAAFSLYALSIDNFDLLLKQYTSGVVSQAVRSIAKHVSMYLPYGAKLAQMSNRDTFLIYVPYDETLDKEVLAASFKMAASEPVLVSAELVLQKHISLGYADYQQGQTYAQVAEQAMMTLIYSKRVLGGSYAYDEQMIVSIADYNEVAKKMRALNVLFKLYDMIDVMKDEKLGYMIDVSANAGTLLEFIKGQPMKDQSWINFWFLEYMLAKMIKNRIGGTMTLPVLTSMFQADYFVETLVYLMTAYELDPNKIVLSIKQSDLSHEQKMIENIISVKELGIHIEYEVRDISPMIYQNLQAYHTDRIGMYETFIKKAIPEAFSELAYFTKANHLDMVIYAESTLRERAIDMYHATVIGQLSSKTDLLNQAATKKRRKVRLK